MVKSLFRKISARSQTGDTIVEVLVSICVISVVLVGCYGVANHSLQTGVEASQRSEVLALAQQQIEYIKASPESYVNQTGSYCIVGGSIKTSDNCRLGTNSQYKVSTTYSNLVFKVVVSWDDVGGNGQDQMSLYYKLPGSFDAPLIKGVSYSNVKSTSATLLGTINPNGNAVSYYFQYGKTTNFGKKTPTGIIGGDKSDHNVSKLITGLDSGAKYFFQLCITDSSCSETASFTTIGSPSAVLLVSPNTVSAGGYVTVSWVVRNVSSCSASGGWWSSASPPSIFGGSTNVWLYSPGVYNFGINCIGTDPATHASDSKLVVVTLPPAPVVSVSANPSSIQIGPGGGAYQSTITWSTANAQFVTSCWKTGSWSGPAASSGSQLTPPLSVGSYTFGITCQDSFHRSSSASATVTVTTSGSGGGGQYCPYGTNPDGTCVQRR